MSLAGVSGSITGIVSTALVAGVAIKAIDIVTQPQKKKRKGNSNDNIFDFDFNEPKRKKGGKKKQNNMFGLEDFGGY